MDWGAEGIEVQVAGVSAALLVAPGLHWTEERWTYIQEPLIGIVFILAAMGGTCKLSASTSYSRA